MGGLKYTYNNRKGRARFTASWAIYLKSVLDTTVDYSRELGTAVDYGAMLAGREPRAASGGAGPPTGGESNFYSYTSIFYAASGSSLNPLLRNDLRQPLVMEAWSGPWLVLSLGSFGLSR